MSTKPKKGKIKTRTSDKDLSESTKEKKKTQFKEDYNNNKDKDKDKEDKDKDEKHHHNQESQEPTRKRKRNHTKVSRKSQENQLDNFIQEDKNQKGKKVKFSKIDVIDVESWKQLNLKMTAEENLEELLKITEGKKERIKNVNCCIII